MDTKLDFKIQTFDVVGRGDLVTSPRQVGEWWVSPLKSYKGSIPAEARAKMADFIATGQPYLGFLIAEDMREIREKQIVEERKQEIRRQKIAEWTGVITAIAGALVIGMICIARIALAIDPMLIVVLKPEHPGEEPKWACLASWWD